MKDERKRVKENRTSVSEDKKIALREWGAYLSIYTCSFSYDILTNYNRF